MKSRVRLSIQTWVDLRTPYRIFRLRRKRECRKAMLTSDGWV